MEQFHSGVLKIDNETALNQIITTLKKQTFEILRKRGLVIAISGGIDSSLTAALAIRSLGPDRVTALSLPERDSNPDNTRLGKLLANHLGIRLLEENIDPVLDAFGCYKRRDEAIKRIFPEYDSSYKLKIVLSQTLMKTGGLNIYSLVIRDPDGQYQSCRLPRRELLEIVAATNHKQRTRTQFTYYHADRLGYAVAGTPNRLEYDQGFFVKGGDGLADVKPIAHLYKTQVYSLARHLKLPQEILAQKPTTDTYSLEQTQEEFYFSLPYEKLDLILWALNHDIQPLVVSKVMGFKVEQIQNFYSDIRQKRRMTEYLHRKALLIEPIHEIVS
ncbi:MAG: NAD(+) synthase [Candidatus Latescibacteria bacterium]|nr:NAD(+) synthase [Candidatus Latescibacterota bacterium]